MTCIAVGRQPRINIVYMATGARHCCVPASERKDRLAVVKCRRLPRRGRVARRAIGREPRVRRTRGAIEIPLMAADTGSGSAGKLATNMALVARNAGVRSRKRKPGCCMIKCRGLPCHRGMTACAIGGEPA
jgi:hypothetical protein